jgi:hypothetical protein
MPTVVLDTGWFKSSFSNAGGDECIECRMAVGSPVRVRDSKSPDAGTLQLTPDAWSSFVATL